MIGVPKRLPEGWHSITTRLFVKNSAAYVQFLKDAFGATGEYMGERPSEMRIGDSIVMVSEVGPRAQTSSALYLYVDDADATYERALKAGATSVEEPENQFYGDRRAMVTDPAGNDWQIATPLRR